MAAINNINQISVLVYKQDNIWIGTPQRMAFPTSRISLRPNTDEYYNQNLGAGQYLTTQIRYEGSSYYVTPTVSAITTECVVGTLNGIMP